MTPPPTTPTPGDESEMPTVRAARVNQIVGGGRFTLLRQLGEGGMGIVWQAMDEQLRELVALKFLPPAIRADPTSLEDLRHETIQSRRLAHPNIVKVYDLHESAEEGAFISMEFVDGRTLSQERINMPGKVLYWAFLKPYIGQLCEALEYAHGEKIIHRDIKPSNVMIDSQRNRAKLADFGIARVMTDSVRRVTMQRPASGTMAYMSCQQMNGEPPCTADDIYSLGATVFELLASKPPFYTGDISWQIRYADPPNLAKRLLELKLTNEVPKGVQETILACLDRDPSKRPASAHEAAEQLGLLETKRPTPRAPRKAAARGSRAASRKGGAADAAAGAVAGDDTAERTPRPASVPGGTEADLRTPPSSAGGTGVGGQGANEVLPQARPTTRRGTRLRAGEAEIAATPEAQVPPEPQAAVPASDVHKAPASPVMLAASRRGDIEGSTPETRHKSRFAIVSGVIAILAVGIGAALIFSQPKKQEQATPQIGVPGQSAANSAPPSSGKMEEIETATKVSAPAAGSGVVPASDPKARSPEPERGLPAKTIESPSQPPTPSRDPTPPVEPTQEPSRPSPPLAQSTAPAATAQAPSAEPAKPAAAEPVKPQAEAVSPWPKAGKGWTNSLDMRFAVVPGLKVLVSIWETRIQDYRTYLSERGQPAEFSRLAAVMTNAVIINVGAYPIRSVSWSNAVAFCNWLTEKERKGGALGPDQQFRLPTDEEWSSAAGLMNEVGTTPEARRKQKRVLYPWGTNWPPKPDAGNYLGEEEKSISSRIKRFEDKHKLTAPVGFYKSNQFGLFDLGGNVWEWTQSPLSPKSSDRVLRGGAYDTTSESEALLSWRHSVAPSLPQQNVGFRCVLELTPPAAP